MADAHVGRFRDEDAQRRYEATDGNRRGEQPALFAERLLGFVDRIDG